MKSDAKILCIGWHKTGTSSLGMALLELGYSVVGARLDLEESLRKGDLSPTIKLAERFDAVQDVPWAALFKELDSAFPGARFIFTDRSDESWLRSAVGHFRDYDISMHEWLYGRGKCVGNENRYLQRYRQHRREVKEWFSDRPDVFLEMNLEKGDGWEKLCAFLDCPVPKAPWPHANKGKHNLSRSAVVLNAIRRVTPSVVRKGILSVRLGVRRIRGLPDPRDKFNNFKQNRGFRKRTQLQDRD